LKVWNVRMMYALISHRFENMQRKLDDLWEEFKNVGFVIN
jgi:hypothetical protein